jgi:hypothetical protein
MGFTQSNETEDKHENSRLGKEFVLSFVNLACHFPGLTK